MFIPPKSRLFSGSEEGTAAFSAFWVLISNELWITMSSYKDVQQCWALWERCTFFFSITQGNQMVAGWLRPRHERSPSTQVHSDLLNSFVTRKLEKFANHFLKSWTMKANTCLPISHEFTALCPPTLSLNYSAFTDTSSSQSSWNIQQAQQSLCERKKVHRSSHFRYEPGLCIARL